jgi:hypothetical protein
MPKFRVDVRIDASIYVEAKDENQARDLALSPDLEDLMEHSAFMADAIRIDSIHDSKWPHRHLKIDDDIVYMEDDDESEDDAE